MKIPFEFVYSLLPNFERSVIGIFKNYGADINASTATIDIDDSRVEALRRMLIMGFVIDCYLEQQNAPSFAFGCVRSDPGLALLRKNIDKITAAIYEASAVNLGEVT